MNCLIYTPILHMRIVVRKQLNQSLSEQLLSPPEIEDIDDPGLGAQPVQSRTER